MNCDYPTWEKKADKRVTKVTLALGLRWHLVLKFTFSMWICGIIKTNITE